MIKNPYYVAEITSSRCSVELSINGIPNYNHFAEEDIMSTAKIDWPINCSISKNGLQHFEVLVLPLKNKITILPKALVRIKIFKTEAIEEYVNQELVSKEIEITFADKKGLPTYIIKNTFPAELPFKIEGWENSVDLSKEDKNELYKEIIVWNEKIAQIYQTSDAAGYKKAFGKRDLEQNRLLYILQNDNPSFHPKDKDILSLPNILYKLELYANGKLASVRMPYELPGFRYDPKIQDENAMGFSLNIYFHRKQKGMPLEIIR